MRFLEFVPAVAAAAPAARAPAVLATAPPAGAWVMTFEETFDGDTLNASRWTPSNWSQVVSQYDGHDALFIADRVRVGGGHLAM